MLSLGFIAAMLFSFLTFEPQTGSGQSLPPLLESFLREYVRLSDKQIAELKTGEIVSKVLDPADKNEVVSFGAVRVAVPRELFLDEFRDIESFKKSKEVLQIGKFNVPPRPGDMDRLSLDRDELRDLRNCEVEDCEIRLTGEMIASIREEQRIWSNPHWEPQATAALRRMLVEYVNDYLAEGNGGLAEYADKKQHRRVADELKKLLDESRYLSKHVPQLNQYLARYPDVHLPESEDFVYWSKEDFGLKPVVSITHVTIHSLPCPDGSSSASIIASKQIYASHYFDASLGLTAFIEEPNRKDAGYLVYLNRSRVDLLHGFLSSFRRGLSKGRLREGLDRHLRLTKEKLEAKYSTQTNPR